MSRISLKTLSIKEQRKTPLYWISIFLFLLIIIFECYYVQLALIGLRMLLSRLRADFVIDPDFLITILENLGIAFFLGAVLICVVLTKPYRQEETRRTI